MIVIGFARTASYIAFGAALLMAGAAIAQQRTTMSGLKLSNDKPIQIESDKLEIREQEKQATFDGNVQVVQGPMTLNATHMTVFYKGDSKSVTAGGGDIDRIEVAGAVSLKSGTQSARGDEGAFDMLSEVLTLKGKQVVLADGNNVFTGCKLTVQMKSGQARLESCGSRVKILIDPQSRKTN
jgi:lipopolysaccharide export system protein LptA